MCPAVLGYISLVNVSRQITIKSRIMASPMRLCACVVGMLWRAGLYLQPKARVITSSLGCELKSRYLPRSVCWDGLPNSNLVGAV